MTDRPPQRHLLRSRRSDAARHPGAARARRDLGERTRRAVRDEPARRLQASQGAGARRPDRAPPRGAMAALPDRGGGAQAASTTGSPNIAGSGRNGSTASTIICKTLQAKGERSVSARNSIDLDRDPRSIIGTRVFDAPRELVFAAFTDPKHLAQWWGPDGFTTTTTPSSSAPAASGASSCTGRTAATIRTASPSTRSLPPERIVYHHGGGDDVEPVQFKHDLTFEDLGGKTRLTWHGVFPSAARARARHQGIRRRQGPGADHGAARRVRGGEGVDGERVMFTPSQPALRTARATRCAGRRRCMP